MSEKNQIDRFKEAARELECDENEKRFDAVVKNLAKPAKPKKDSKDGK